MDERQLAMNRRRLIASCRSSMILALQPQPSGRVGVQEVEQQTTERPRLLLLHPVSGAVNEVRPLVVRGDLGLEALESTRVLIHPPVALAAHERSGHVDRPSRKQLEIDVARTATIPVEAALESRA